MKRSRLKNIINKSKGFSNKPAGESPFDSFKKSLPIEVNDSYRLEAAWKAYGSPKDYKEALWQGLIQPIDETNVKLPSIGYNEETDEYEYLNKGKENETVAKDIRVWDNDVIPLVKELKLGGYIRTYNEEKECWTYSKNKPQENQEISSFQKGGNVTKKKDKQSYYEFLETLPSNLRKGNVDDGDGIEKDDGYRMELLFQNDPDVWTFEDGIKKGYFNLNKEDGLYHSGSIIKMPDGHYEFLKSAKHPTVGYETNWYKYHPGAKEFRQNYELVTTDENGNPLKYYKYIKRQPQSFKQGGQMNVIPEGALHARKNNMEGAGEDFTAKGIPVVDNDGNQQAEIECNEIVFNKEVTNKIEELYKKFNSDEISQSKKDELAIKAGKLLSEEIIENTDDRTGLIEEIKQKM